VLLRQKFEHILRGETPCFSRGWMARQAR